MLRQDTVNRFTREGEREKSETRNSRSERNPKSESFGFRFSGFFRASVLDFRIWTVRTLKADLEAGLRTVCACANLAA